MENGSKYVVLFPFMAQGHFIPFLALAQKILQKGYSIIFISTPLNVRNLKKSFDQPSSSTSATVKFAVIPFNAAEHGFPPEGENTDSLPLNLIIQLITASLSLKLPFKALISDLSHSHGGERPLCVISDFFFGWAADVAHEFGISHLIFSMTGGFGMACLYSIWLNFKHRFPHGDDFLLPDFPEAGKIHVTQVMTAIMVGREDDPFADFVQKRFLSWANSDGLLLNTVTELDKMGIKYFERKLNIPVWAIGPLLLPQVNRERTGTQSAVSPEECTKWLDQKESNSVIYISFGSQTAISTSKTMKLAKALDSSGRNFIWVLRPPSEFDTSAEFVAEEWLPEGFMHRVREEDKALIISKWAPQVEILAHKSVGAFVSHCGWNSALEAMRYGTPVIGWPMNADQFYNSKFLVEDAGVCVEIATGADLEVSAEEIVEKIELVMGGNGEEIRRKALEIKGVIGNAIRDEDVYRGSSVKAMDEFLDAVRAKKTRADDT